MDLIVVGINHRAAPVEIREQVALNEQQAREAMASLVGDQVFPEAMLLSTCNRTELYCVTNNPAQDEARARSFLNALHRVEHFSVDGCAYAYRERDAVRHMLKVAGGLDSMILGEPQIFGQVKDAYGIACDVDAAGVFLHRLMHQTFRVGKRVRTETSMGAGAVSVSFAAAELAGKIFQNIQRHSALMIGSGETGELAARHLLERGIRDLIIINRTEERAQKLAAELGGRAEPFEHLEELLAEVDLVISATAATQEIVTVEHMQRVMKRRKSKSIMLIDIAVPRDIAPGIRDLDNVYLYDIDTLQTIVDQNLEKRRAAVPQAEAMIDEALGEHERWIRQLTVTPMIKALRDHFETVRNQEIEKNGKYFRQEDQEQLDRFTRSMMQRLLHEPTVTLRGYTQDDPLYIARMDTLCALFKLHPEAIEPDPPEAEDD
jgi:glutamyl-tRNA reductase